jgi:deazaflavin-dependent oxidoreductase (nitroreductase family)
MEKETPAEAAGFLAHLKAYREDPQKGHDWNPYGKQVTALLLTVTGKATGKPRTRPLIYRKVGDNYILVASKGGAPDHPFWYKNLLADPRAEIQVIHDHIKVRARTAEGAERAALWAQMVDLLPQYAEYQARTDRELPVIVLEPEAG